VSKFQDLLNGKIPEYSGAIVIHDEDEFTITAQDPQGQWVEFTCPRLAEGWEAVQFSKIPRGFMAVGYPYFNHVSGMYVYKVLA